MTRSEGIGEVAGEGGDKPVRSAGDGNDRGDGGGGCSSGGGTAVLGRRLTQRLSTNKGKRLVTL